MDRVGIDHDDFSEEGQRRIKALKDHFSESFVPVDPKTIEEEIHKAVKRAEQRNWPEEEDKLPLPPGVAESILGATGIIIL